MWIALYVDDMLMVGDEDLIEDLVTKVSSQYTIRDLGVPETFLGMEITRDKDRKSITLTCTKFIENITKRFSLERAKPERVPLHGKLTMEDQSTNKDGSKVDSTEYRSFVGSIMYASTTCRPDIAFAVKELSRFLIDPLQSHLKAAKRVISYLYSTRHLGLKYSATKRSTVTGHHDRLWATKNPDQVYGFSDSDWAGEIPGRKSTSGYVFMLNGAAISWRSQSQPLVALSTAEAEYIALAEAAKEALHLRKLMAGFEHKDPDSADGIILFEDNTACESWTRNEADHNRTRHIDTRYHMIRDNVKKGNIDVNICPTTEMVADIMTKDLNFDLHSRTTNRMMGHASQMAREGYEKTCTEIYSKHAAAA